MLRKEEKMSITDAQVQSILAQLDDLKNEIVRLDGVLERNMEAVGLTVDDLRKLEHSEPPQEVKKVVDEIKLQAQRAGEQVARDLNVQTQPKSPKRTSSRAGVIKL
jgi:hypothetical protein